MNCNNCPVQVACKREPDFVCLVNQTYIINIAFGKNKTLSNLNNERNEGSE